MAVELLLPGRRIPAPKPPSYLALDMAFGVGAGAVLGDKSRYRSHGAITTATWVAGLHGYCLNFVAANPDYVTIPAGHTQLNFTSEDFSIIFRFNADSLAPNPILFNRGLWMTDGYNFQLVNNGDVEFWTWQTPAWQVTRAGVGTILINTCYTLGLSRAGANARIYRNGVDVTGAPGVHIDPQTSARNARIGIYCDLAQGQFDGRIEFLRVFRGIALAASEHLAWHNALA